MIAWEPILANPERDAADQAIDAILQDLRGNETTANATLLCESALLYAYIGQSRDSSLWKETAADQLNRAIEAVSEGWPSNHVALYGGLAEVGWIVEHVGRMLQEDDLAEGDDDPLIDVDGSIISHLKAADEYPVYDLISGLVGLGVYFIQRYPRESAVTGLKLVLKHLERYAIKVHPGKSWFTPPELLPKWQRERYPRGYFNLGVAHGVPGIIYLLAESLTSGIDPNSGAELLAETVSWLQAQQNPPHMLTRFGSWAMPDMPPENSRLGWCYGDLGLAAVLHEVAGRIGRSDWRSYAKRILDRCIVFPLQDAGCNDAALCHGALGVSHILNRIYQQTQDPRFREAAIDWIRRGLGMRRPGSGIGGFFAYRPDESPVWDPDPTFLSGAVGIGLSLLSAIYPVEPQWDQLLLLSSTTSLR